MAVKAEVKMEVRRTKIIRQPITLKNRQKKFNLVPQVQEVLLELRMKYEPGYKMHKL